MAKGYRIIEGIAMADIAFEVKGKSLNKLFEQSALAVESVMVELNTVKKVQSREFVLESDTVESLLYLFLNELVYLKDAEQLLFSRAKVVVSKKKRGSHDGWALRARLAGDKINQKQKIGTDVKAVTLHMFEVKKGYLFSSRRERRDTQGACDFDECPCYNSQTTAYLKQDVPDCAAGKRLTELNKYKKGKKGWTACFVVDV